MSSGSEVPAERQYFVELTAARVFDDRSEHTTRSRDHVSWRDVLDGETTIQSAIGGRLTPPSESWERDS